MNNPVAIEEADNDVTNGHQNGNDSDAEFGPTPAKVEKKVWFRRIVGQVSKLFFFLDFHKNIAVRTALIMTYGTT